MAVLMTVHSTMELKMKKLVVAIMALGMMSGIVHAKGVEQTICFSKKFSENKSTYFPNGVPLATLGDDVKLYGGKCQQRTLPEMNKAGWKLIQVVTGLNNSFGMVLEK